MAIYALSDLHLSLGVKDKPMNVFGDKWNDYEAKIKKNWNQKINEEDIVIIAGDISWAMYLEDSLEDFEYISSLNGQKIILKGNHDYWWTTLNKLDVGKLTQYPTFTYVMVVYMTAIIILSVWIIKVIEKKDVGVMIREV